MSGSHPTSQETKALRTGMMLSLKILETWSCLLWELWLWAGAQNDCLGGLRRPQVLASWEETWCLAHFGLCEPKSVLIRERVKPARPGFLIQLLQRILAGLSHLPVSGHTLPEQPDCGLVEQG